MTLRTRTKAQREAIDARAAAFERPISAWQLEALRCMAKSPLVRGRAGWASPHLVGKYWQSQTVRALAGRGLCSLRGGNVGREKLARITPKGRMELKKHSPREGRHAWGLPT